MCTEGHPEAKQYEEATPALQAPKIIGVIKKKWQYSDDYHYSVVVDRDIKLRYSRTPYGPGDNPYHGRPGWYFIGKDGDFYDYLAGTDRKGDAFGGRVFDIELDDGSKFTCNGDVWSVGRPKDGSIDTIEVGYASQKQLNECYVFIGGSILRSTLEAWLAVNTPTDDYHAFDPKEPARKAYVAEQKRLAEELAAKQAACTHDYEEAEGLGEAGFGEDVYEVPVDFKRCKLCGHETEHVARTTDYEEY